MITNKSNKPFLSQVAFVSYFHQSERNERKANLVIPEQPWSWGSYRPPYPLDWRGLFSPTPCFTQLGHSRNKPPLSIAPVKLSRALLESVSLLLKITLGKKDRLSQE